MGTTDSISGWLVGKFGLFKLADFSVALALKLVTFTMTSASSTEIQNY